MSLYLLSKVIKHKKIMSVLLLLSIILPLLVMCAVGFTQFRLLKSNVQRANEVAAIMERRDAIIARNDTFRHYAREADEHMDGDLLAGGSESALGLRGLDRETAETIREKVISDYDPELEQRLWGQLENLKRSASSPNN